MVFPIFRHRFAKAKRLPAMVELLALELPGRGSRMGEAPAACATLTELAQAVLDGVGRFYSFLLVYI